MKHWMLRVYVLICPYHTLVWIHLNLLRMADLFLWVESYMQWECAPTLVSPLHEFITLHHWYIVWFNNCKDTRFMFPSYLSINATADLLKLSSMISNSQSCICTSKKHIRAPWSFLSFCLHLAESTKIDMLDNAQAHGSHTNNTCMLRSLRR